AEPADGDWAAAFAAAHETRFGYRRSGRAVEIVTARVRVRGRAAELPAAAPASAPDAPPAPRRHGEAWFPERGRVRVPLYDREALTPGAVLEGPAIVLEATGTIVVDPGFEAVVLADGVLRLEDRVGARRPAVAS